MKLDIEQINKAFSPTQEIIDPKHFIGRYNEISEGVVGLTRESSFLAIYGLRGIGKTSIAYQLKLIAEGDKTLAKRAGVAHLLPKKGFSFIVHFVKCDEFVRDIYGLMKRIIYGDDMNPSIFSHTNNEGKRLEQFKEKANLTGTIGVSMLKGEVKTEDETTYSHKYTDDIIQEFRLALGVIQKDNQGCSGLLILIDEFDILQDKRGFSSLVKTCSSKFVKFGIVGIGGNIEELIEDHASVGRQLSGIYVNRMPNSELMQIINNAESFLNKEIMFDTDVIEAICNHAEGFPYFVHLLGSECLLAAFNNKTKYVTTKTLAVIMNKFSNGEFKLAYEAKYSECCRTSAEREAILRLFAFDDNNSSLTEEIYQVARDLGIKNPGSYMRELHAPIKGNAALVLSHDKRHYRFADPIFKVYIKKRKALHDKFERGKV